MTTFPTMDELDDNERLVNMRHAHDLAETIMQDIQKIDPDEMSRAYRELALAPVMADMLRQQVGVEISKDGKFLNICAEKAPTPALTKRITQDPGEFLKLLRDPTDQKFIPLAEVAAKSVVVAAKYVQERSANLLLTSHESDVLVAALSIAFGRALGACVKQDHPGDVQGHA